eukprot:gene5327-9136_t
MTEQLQQWTKTVKTSSYYLGYPSTNILGEPTVYPEYGDHKNAWAPQKPNGTKEWVEIFFEKPVLPNKIKIYETFNPGSCVKVSARTPTFEWVELWSGKKQENVGKAVINEIDLKQIDFLVEEIRLDLDCEKNEGFYQIDAIQLTGSENEKLLEEREKEKHHSQWVKHATASTYCIGYPTSNLVGKPTTYPEYGDLKTSWSPEKTKGTLEWLELHYKYPMIPQKIKVYETYNPGSLVKVSGKNVKTDEWIELWSGEKQKNVGKSIVNEVQFKEVDFKVENIRLEMDCMENKGYYQIDAVQLFSSNEISADDDLNLEESFDKIQKEVQAMKDSVAQFIEFAPKIAKEVPEFINLLTSDRFIGPIKKLFEMFKAIPLENLKNYASKSVVIIKKFDEAVQSGDYLPKSKFNCITVDMVRSMISGTHTGEKLNEFVAKMNKITSVVTENIPMEFFDKVLHFISKYSNLVIEKFTKALKQAQEFVDETKPIIDKFTELMNPVELLTSYFDHMDKDGDGKLSIQEIADIGSSVDFFKEKGMGKKEMIEEILSDLQKLKELVKSFEVKKEIMETVKEIDFNDISEIFIMIIDLIKDFDTNKFLKYLEAIKTILEFINEYKDILQDIIDSQKSSVNCITILSFLFRDSEFISAALDLLKDISQDIDFGEVFTIFTDFNAFFLENELFKSTEMMDGIVATKNLIRTMLISVFSIIRKLESLLKKAIKRGSEIEEVAGTGMKLLKDFNNVKDGVTNFLDADGDGKLDMNDLKGAKDKIFSGVKGLFGKK